MRKFLIVLFCIILNGYPSVLAEGKDLEKQRQLLTVLPKMFKALPPLMMKYSMEAETPHKNSNIVVDYSFKWDAPKFSFSRTEKLHDSNFSVFAFDGSRYQYLRGLEQLFLSQSQNEMAPFLGSCWFSCPLSLPFLFAVGDSDMNEGIAKLSSLDTWVGVAERIESIEDGEVNGSPALVLKVKDKKGLAWTIYMAEDYGYFPAKVVMSKQGQFRTTTTVENFLKKSYQGEDVFVPTVVVSERKSWDGKPTGFREKIVVEEDSLKFFEKIPKEIFRVSTTNTAMIYDMDLGEYLKHPVSPGKTLEGRAADEAQ